MKSYALQGHSRPIKQVEFSQNGDYLYTASMDRTIVGWNMQTNTKAFTLTLSAAVTRFTMKKDMIIAGDTLGCVYFWDRSKGTLLKKFEHDCILAVKSVECIDDSVLVVTYAGKGKLADSFINVYLLKDILTYAEKPKNTNTYYASDSIYSIYDTKSTSNSLSVSHEKILPIKHIECNNKTKYAITKYIKKYSANSCLLAGREDGIVEIINLTTCKIVEEKQLHSDAVMDLHICYEKNVAMSVGKEGTVIVFDLDSLEVLETFKENRQVNCGLICLLEREEECKVENEVSSMQIQFDSFTELNKISDSTTVSIDSVDVSENKKTQVGTKRLIVIGGGDTSNNKSGFEVNLYTDIESKENNISINEHFGPINSLAYHKEKKLLASGSEDSQVRVYNMETLVIV